MKDKLIAELLSIEEELQYVKDKGNLKRKYNKITKLLKTIEERIKED